MAQSRYYWQIGFGLLLLACPACMAPGGGAGATAVATAAAPNPAAAGNAAAVAAAGGAPLPPADPALAPPTGPLAKCCQAIEDCRRKLCKTPFGQLLNGMTAPISGLTGGVIPGFCPTTVGLMDLMKPGVEGEAAAVKKEAAEAKARVAAVRLLGTVDCRYYPDAEGKLILALRTDGSECVRIEAAIALGRGCCCTRKVIEALDITVAGLETDGAPAERSPRVRDFAAESLAHCLACNPVAPPDAELPVPKKRGELDDEEVSAQPKKPVVSRAPTAKTLAHAKATLEAYQALKDALPPAPPPTEKSLLSLFRGDDDRPAAIPAQPTAVTARPALPTVDATPVTLQPPARMPASLPDVKPAASLLLPD